MSGSDIRNFLGYEFLRPVRGATVGARTWRAQEEKESFYYRFIIVIFLGVD